MPSPRHPRATQCRHCGAALTALQAMRGGTCLRPACRRAATDAASERQRSVELGRRLGAAVRAGAPAALPRYTVLWLVPHETRMTALPRALRERVQQHLADLAAGRPGPPLPDHGVLPVAEAEPPMPAAGVCALCRGRCCRPGREFHGFVDRALLERWTVRHPGTTLADAARAYRRCLPRRHVAGSCAFHGARGCTLPREMRSDLCNAFRCDGLRQALELQAPGLVVALPAPAGLQRAAWLQHDRSGPLPRRGRSA